MAWGLSHKGNSERSEESSVFDALEANGFFTSFRKTKL